MSRNLHAVDVLTEFARDFEDEEPENLISRFVNRITNAVNTATVEETASTSSAVTSPVEETKPPTETPVTPEETKRTPLSVIKRISNLVAQKDSNLNNYRDTDLQKFWMPDAKSKECYECTVKFTTFRRRHHCRLCGQIFCSKCCNQVVPGKIIKCAGDLKVCTYCSKVVLSYLKSPDITADLRSDLQALQVDLGKKLSVTEDAIAKKQLRKISLGYQEERLISSPNLTHADRRNILQSSNSIKILAEEMAKSVQGTVNGRELIAFMMSTKKSAEETNLILNALIDAGFLIPMDFPDNVEDCLPHKLEFDESATYNLLKVTEQVEIESLPPTPDLYSTIKDYESQESLFSTVAAKPLLESFCEHEEQLISQLLRKEHVDEAWSKILIPICARVANTIRPEILNIDSMDIRNFVNFKKVPAGHKTDSKIVGGIVFSKNVTHKDMPTHIEKPKVLLLQCAILFQRVEGRFVSLDNLLLQEHEYLRNMTARILSYGANIVLVHKSVSGIAQEMLRQKGITLVLDVKLLILERLARCLQCDIISSIDSQIKSPKLGICDAFYRKTYKDTNTGAMKTLMFFETRYNPRGCCILLRGGPTHELNKIKKIASRMLFARYNWRHEMAFLLDEFAQSPLSNPFETPNQSPDRPSLPPIKEEEDRNKVRKPEKLEVQRENVQEGDDPLRASTENQLVSPTIQLLSVQKTYDNKFRNALSTTILSVSPNVTFPLPYLETEQGRNCALRERFPEELYYSKQWSTTPVRETMIEIEKNPNAVELLPKHEYITHQVTAPFDSKIEQNLLANFRAKGGMFPKQLKMKIVAQRQAGKIATHPQRPIEEYVYKDALDLDNHQRLPVLFYSYYSNPKATSSFCVLPYMLEMTFYGQNDITLGLFLERYCFRSSYICQFCNLPMTDHVRRYVHSMGCVQVKLHEDAKRSDPKNIMMSSWCSACNEWTPTVPMSKDTWCLSLAKYLELRFHGHTYKRHYLDRELKEGEGCHHSLHRDYIQLFSSNGLVARITYEPIEIWEITLPPMFIRLKHLKEFDKQQVLEDIKGFAMKGYEAYAHIHDQIADICPEIENANMTNLKLCLNQDQLNFKQRVEVVQTLLTEEPLNNYEINDAMLMVKRALCESIDIWGPRLHEAALHAKALFTKGDTNPVDNATICTEDFQSDPSSPSSHTGESEPEEDVDTVALEEANFRQKLSSTDSKQEPHDKKTIKQRLVQFLASSGTANIIPSPIAVHEHHTLPLGAFPILVHDQDLSSVIAYSLISHDYEKALSHPPDSPTSTKRKAELDFEPERDEKEKEKERIKKSHIDISFQDTTTTFSCKIYYAREFDALRRNFLCSPLFGNNDTKEYDRVEDEYEEVRKSFARSLCRSVKWEARGGKSGSKFSKTIDDQFVLKEMSRTDIGIFENFAPNYFEYINQCLTEKKPTLLAKIFGVYKIMIKKKDYLFEKSILVMEHLFVNREISNKFDLKGSERNRLVDPTNQTGEIVLLDENLMQSEYY